MHFLGLLLLSLHVQRRYATGVAGRLLEDDTGAVHVQTKEFDLLMSSIVCAVVVGRMLMMSRRGRGLSSGLLSYGKVSLSRALRAGTEQSEHWWLKEALVRAG